MRKIILGFTLMSSVSAFAATSLGVGSKICKDSSEIAAAKIELYSKINFESSEYIQLEQSGKVSRDELERRLRKIEEAHEVIDAVNVFCKD